MRPTLKELNNKIWYRVLKVIAILISVGAFIGPWMIREPHIGLLLDGIINVLIWITLIMISRSAILYVIYGKNEKTSEERAREWQWVIWGGASFITVVCFLVWIILFSQYFYAVQ